jgi:hypothetical protein
MPAPRRIATIFFHPNKCCFDSDSNKIVVETCRKEPTAIGTMMEKKEPPETNSSDSITAAGATREKSSTTISTVSFL